MFLAPATGSQGYMQMVVVPSPTGNYGVTISNVDMSSNGQSATISIPLPGSNVSSFVLTNSNAIQVLNKDLSINTVRVGLGANSIADNMAVGVSALSANTGVGAGNTAVGYQSMQLATAPGSYNTFVGSYTASVSASFT